MNTTTRCKKSLDQLCYIMVPELTTVYMLSREWNVVTFITICIHFMC